MSEQGQTPVVILQRSSVIRVFLVSDFLDCVQLVDGFSKIRRVGPNTPLIMSNDVTTLKSSLEQLTKLKPFPFVK